MPRQEGQANAGAGVGSVRVPPKGSKMFITYDGNDPHFLYYGNSPTTDDVNKDNPLLQEDYPHTYGQVDQAGNLIKVNTKKGTSEYVHQSGATLHIAKDGSMTFSSPKNVTISSEGDLNITSKGKMQVHATGDMNVKGSRIDLNDGSAPNQAIATTARPVPQIDQKQGRTTL
jgi:hypothetical protein